MAQQQSRTLRRGFTTGACAAAAAKAATAGLLTGHIPAEIEITLPGGQTPRFAVLQPRLSVGEARCAIRKDAGDDPDVTNGVLVYASVSRTQAGVSITGGPGVGRVTKPGLQCAVGEYAINHGPRVLIERSVLEAAAAHGVPGGFSVAISIPEGEALARRTYNQRLGIVGGISVLGTTGVVEPMSEQALVDSIGAELDVLHASGAACVLAVPGNYGEVFARDTLGFTRAVLCSNFVGDTIDMAAARGFCGLLLVGGLGKLVKLAGGIFNTHSHHADCRLELITAHAALAGADRALSAALLQCVTTDEALVLLDQAGLRQAVVTSLLERIDFHLSHRADSLSTGAVVFSEKYGLLGETPGAKRLRALLGQQEGQA